MPNLTAIAQQVSGELIGLATAIEAERVSHPQGVLDIQAAYLRRQDMGNRLARLHEELTIFTTSLNTLRLPSPRLMVWAQSLLDLPNAAILEVDTTGLDHTAEVIRVMLLSMSGDVLCDRLLCPSSGHSNQEHTGITPETLAQAQPLEHGWAAVMAELRTYYLIAFGMDFDVDHIAAQNARLNAPPYRLFTEDLQRGFTDYFHQRYYTKLEEVAVLIGHSMPAKPERNALDRATATLAVLQAVAGGVLRAESNEVSGEEFPF